MELLRMTDLIQSDRSIDADDRCIENILDSLDALVYVADMQTYELLFANKYGINIWGDYHGKVCWQVLQDGQDGPCSFCTNHYLLDEFGSPADAHVWEFQNTINHRWYQCRDQAIRWTDGRLVRLEIATDITDRKNVENELRIAKQHAEQLAEKDELTQLCNRRSFFRRGHRALEQSKRFGHPTSVIMMDIDKFKAINDNYGHAAGDKVLRALADLMRSLVREIDIVARMGGEEFALVLPETGLDDAAILAERLRSAIEKLEVSDGKRKIRQTASFGVATSKNSIGSIEALLRAADDALYVAKRMGRNKVCTD